MTHVRCTQLIAKVTLLIMLALTPALSLAQDAAAPAVAEKVDYGALAAALEDEHARKTLIEELRALSKEAKGEGEAGVAQEIAAESPSDQTAAEVSLARRMAEVTSSVAASFGDQFSMLITGLGELFDGAAAGPTVRASSSDIGQAALQLLMVIVAAVVVFAICRALASRSFQGLSNWVRNGSGKLALVRTILAVILAAIVDALAVAVAYAGGGFAATFVAEEGSAGATRVALFLNAFLIVEMLKVGLRMLFSSRYAALRLIPVSAPQARYCSRFFATIVNLVGYGVLVLVPIINFNVSPELGAAVSSLIILLAALYAAIIILKQRKSLRDKLQDRAANSSGTGAVGLRMLAKVWHLLALAYVACVLVVSILHPETALPFVAQASLKTLLYIGGGLLLVGVFSQLIGREISLSESLSHRMPRLQSRINTYVPTSLKVFRGLVLIAVVVLSLDAWQIFDLGAWYATDVGSRTVSSLVDILIIISAAALLWVVLASLIEHHLTPAEGTSPAAAARSATLLGLFNTTLAVAIIIMTSMIVLSEIGVNIGPLIAGAGVLGLAVGFGAQKLVQDVITGVFIQLENAMNTGDFVTAGSNSGTVERVGLRSVALRDLYGTYHIVPFSSVDAVSNFTREFGNHVGEYGIAYRENIDEAVAQLHAAFEELKEGPHKNDILEPLNVAGVTKLADSSVNIRAVIKTTAGNQWAVGRAYNRLVKMYFDKAGIEIPFPHTTLYFGEDKDGSAPAGNIHLTAGSEVVPKLPQQG